MDADAAVSSNPPPRSVALHRAMDSWNRLVAYMFQYQDGTCLAALRIAFGFLMLIDTVDERGFCQVDRRWMEPNRCYFPLFDFVRPLPGRWMCVAYASMFAGILGVLTGFHYRASCVAYAVPYWYMLLADKSAWNNHSYLFGLLAVVFTVTDAHHNWSADERLRRLPAGATGAVPRWNYLLLRIQFFVMYFVAGLKKLEPDWLSGYSMKSLGNHGVFAPFRYVLPAEFVDWWIVHVTGFLIDLLSGFGLCFQRSRPFTAVVLLAFHTMNSMMFAIGMFPYVCAAMIPVFYDPNSVAEKLTVLVAWKKNATRRPNARTAVARQTQRDSSGRLRLCRSADVLAVLAFHNARLQRMAERSVRIFVGHDGVQRGRRQNPSQGGRSRSSRAVLLGPVRVDGQQQVGATRRHDQAVRRVRRGQHAGQEQRDDLHGHLGVAQRPVSPTAGRSASGLVARPLVGLVPGRLADAGHEAPGPMASLDSLRRPRPGRVRPRVFRRLSGSEG